MGDNYRFLLCSTGDDHFGKIMRLAFASHSRATHYKVTDKHGLILYWTEPKVDKDAIKLPYEMTAEAATSFAWNWLQQAKYSGQPDHDGDNEKGFTVFNEDWGHVGGQWEAFVAIMPTWQMYGK